MPGSGKLSIDINYAFKLSRGGTVMACRELIFGGHIFMSQEESHLL